MCTDQCGVLSAEGRVVVTPPRNTVLRTQPSVLRTQPSVLRTQSSVLRTQSSVLGFSLIEAVLFMVVVSVALVVLLKAFNQAAVASADPVLRRQSLAIAQSLLEEISLKDFANPSPGGYAGPYNATTRGQFDDVMDYNGLTLNGLSDLSGTPVAGLSGYRADIAVTAAAFGGVPTSAGWRITVSVTDPAGRAFALDGYRANY